MDFAEFLFQVLPE
jgi:hypothetical protein